MKWRQATRRAVVLVAAASGAIALAACGGGSNSAGSAGSPSSSSASTSAALAAARQVLSQYTSPPTKITQTQTLPSAPPRGKTFVWMMCDISSCTYIGDGLKAAVTAVGWKYKQIDYQSENPATLTAAMKQALALHPAAVGVTGVPPDAGWSSVIPAYKAAGVPIITGFIGQTPLNSTLVANVGGPPVFAEYAKLVANWFIANSNGQGEALIQRIDAYPILKAYSDDLVADIRQGCPGCNISTVVQNTAAQAASNEVVPSVVSALKRDPSIKYLLPCDLEFFDALPSALAAAGLSVKVAGQNPTIQTLVNMKAGKIAAAPSHPLAQAGWVMADVAFREAMHLPIPAADDGPLPSWLLTPSADFPTNQLAEWPANYPGQFEKLWHLGS